MVDLLPRLKPMGDLLLDVAVAAVVLFPSYGEGVGVVVESRIRDGDGDAYHPVKPPSAA